MKIYYTYTNLNYYAGSIETNKKNKPPRSTETEVPVLSEAEYAKYVSSTDDWIITTTAPVRPDTVEDVKAKWIKLGDMLNIVPNDTIRLLEKIRDDANYNNTEEAADGDMAAVLLAFLLLGNPVDVNGDGFGSKAAWMVAHPNLNITAEHLEKIQNATQESTGGVILT